MTVINIFHSPDPVIKKIVRGEMGTVEALETLEQRHETQPMAGVRDSATVTAALWELNLLIGLSEVKRVVEEIKAYVEIQQKRLTHHLKCDPLVLHMIFKGNPGTGKTTVARILGKLLSGLGVLSKGQLIEAERADLVGEYIGHTAQKTRALIQKAMGVILFIDEAYSLGRGGDKDFGKEAIDVLVKGMEDYRNDFVLVLAGYRREMEYFMRINPGFHSRFPIQITFPDYSISELMDIAVMMATERHYRFSPQARQVMQAYLTEQFVRQANNFSNARLVRNLLEKAIRRQALRLSKLTEPTREELLTIEAVDLGGEGK